MPPYLFMNKPMTLKSNLNKRRNNIKNSLLLQYLNIFYYTKFASSNNFILELIDFTFSFIIVE